MRQPRQFTAVEFVFGDFAFLHIHQDRRPVLAALIEVIHRLVKEIHRQVDSFGRADGDAFLEHVLDQRACLGLVHDAAHAMAGHRAHAAERGIEQCLLEHVVAPVRADQQRHAGLVEVVGDLRDAPGIDQRWLRQHMRVQKVTITSLPQDTSQPMLSTMRNARSRPTTPAITSSVPMPFWQDTNKVSGFGPCSCKVVSACAVSTLLVQ